MERPLLVGGRKFDIRLLVLVTPDHRVFMYRDSYVRTASTVYDPSNIDDKSIRPAGGTASGRPGRGAGGRPSGGRCPWRCGLLDERGDGRCRSVVGTRPPAARLAKGRRRAVQPSARVPGARGRAGGSDEGVLRVTRDDDV